MKYKKTYSATNLPSTWYQIIQCIRAFNCSLVWFTILFTASGPFYATFFQLFLSSSCFWLISLMYCAFPNLFLSIGLLFFASWFFFSPSLLQLSVFWILFFLKNGSWSKDEFSEWLTTPLYRTLSSMNVLLITDRLYP